MIDLIIGLAVFGLFLMIALTLGGFLLGILSLVFFALVTVVTWPFRKIWEIYKRSRDAKT